MASTISRMQYAALARQPRRGRQQRLADGPLGVVHVRGVTAGAGATALAARAAPAGHQRRRLADGSGLDSGRRDTVQRHAGLLASRWIRHPSDYQGPLFHSGATPPALQKITKRYVCALWPVFKQALRRT